jgi:antitoxin VapB
VAINIKNDRVCDLIRRASELSGRSQVSVVEEALERYLADASSGPDAGPGGPDPGVERILARIDASLTPTDADAVRASLDDLYDDDGLPA